METIDIQCDTKLDYDFVNKDRKIGNTPIAKYKQIITVPPSMVKKVNNAIKYQDEIINNMILDLYEEYGFIKKIK